MIIIKRMETDAIQTVKLKKDGFVKVFEQARVFHSVEITSNKEMRNVMVLGVNYAKDHCKDTIVIILKISLLQIQQAKQIANLSVEMELLCLVKFVMTAKTMGTGVQRIVKVQLQVGAVQERQIKLNRFVRTAETEFENFQNTVMLAQIQVKDVLKTAHFKQDGFVRRNREGIHAKRNVVTVLLWVQKFVILVRTLDVIRAVNNQTLVMFVSEEIQNLLQLVTRLFESKIKNEQNRQKQH